MRSLPDFDPSPYDSKIDSLFSRLEDRRPTNRTTLVINKASLNKASDYGLKAGVVAGALFVVAAGVSIDIKRDNLPDLTAWVVGFSSLALSSFYLAAQLTRATNKLPVWVDAGLGLIGRSLPLTKHHAEQIANWSKRHPRLVDLLGRWQANNADVTLNMSNYRALSSTMHKVKKVEDARSAAEGAHDREQRRRQDVDAVLRDTGIASAATRIRLEDVASHADPGRLTAPTPKRSI